MDAAKRLNENNSFTVKQRRKKRKWSEYVTNDTYSLRIDRKSEKTVLFSLYVMTTWSCALPCCSKRVNLHGRLSFKYSFSTFFFSRVVRVSAYLIHVDEQRRSYSHLHESAYHFAYFCVRTKKLKWSSVAIQRISKCIMCFSIHIFFHQKIIHAFVGSKSTLSIPSPPQKKTRQFLF